jgi:hypothetical protein
MFADLSPRLETFSHAPADVHIVTSVIYILIKYFTFYAALLFACFLNVSMSTSIFQCMRDFDPVTFMTVYHELDDDCLDVIQRNGPS